MQTYIKVERCINTLSCTCISASTYTNSCPILWQEMASECAPFVPIAKSTGPTGQKDAASLGANNTER